MTSNDIARIAARLYEARVGAREAGGNVRDEVRLLDLERRAVGLYDTLRSREKENEAK